MKFSNEIKVGIVVLVAAAISFYFFGKTVTLRKETYEVKALFEYGGDLKSDAIVKLSGIEVGRLKKMNFVYDPKTRVECLLEIDSSAKVRKDSVVYIGTAGILGDAYIGITPGVSSKFAVSGDILASEDPVQMRIIMKQADNIAGNLDKILTEIKSMVINNKQGISNIVGNLEDVTENFNEFSSDLKQHPWKLMFKGE